MTSAYFDIYTEPDMEAILRFTPSPGPGVDPNAYWGRCVLKARRNPATSVISKIVIVRNGLPFETLQSDEETILRGFWDRFEDIDVWHYDSDGRKGRFDPRFLVVRSWVRRVPVPRSAYDSGPGWSLSAKKWVDESKS